LDFHFSVWQWESAWEWENRKNLNNLIFNRETVMFANIDLIGCLKTIKVLR